MKKRLLGFVIICTCISLITLVGCTKTIGLVDGTYTTNNIKLDENLTIDYLQLDIYNQESADDEIISISLSYNSGETLQATNCALTYYSKELKIAFEFADKVGYIIAKTKQNGDKIFIEGNLTIDNIHSNIKLNKAA